MSNLDSLTNTLVKNTGTRWKRDGKDDFFSINDYFNGSFLTLLYDWQEGKFFEKHFIPSKEITECRVSDFRSKTLLFLGGGGNSPFFTLKTTIRITIIGIKV